MSIYYVRQRTEKFLHLKFMVVEGLRWLCDSGVISCKDFYLLTRLSWRITQWIHVVNNKHGIRLCDLWLRLRNCGADDVEGWKGGWEASLDGSWAVNHGKWRKFTRPTSRALEFIHNLLAWPSGSLDQLTLPLLNRRFLLPWILLWELS